MSTVTDGTTTVTPDLVIGLESRRPIHNKVHDILRPPNTVASLKPAGLRSGQVRYLCKLLTTALALEQLHAGTAPLTLTLTDRSALSMVYVPVDRLELELDAETRDWWIVTVQFQEIVP